MKKILLFILSLCAVTSAFAQSAESKNIEFDIDEAIGMFMPPDLYVDIDFADDNNNQILEANEGGIITLSITNKGGNADKVNVNLNLDRNISWLTFKDSFRGIVTSVGRNSTRILKFPVIASADTPTDSLKIKIRVSEPLGYDIEALMKLYTYEMPKPLLKFQGVAIIDAGRGLRAAGGNPDGKLQKGEVVNALIFIQNIGQGEAKNVSYTLESRDPNLLIVGDNGVVKKVTANLPNMKIGETKEIVVRISPNNNYKFAGKYIPLYLSVSESLNAGGIISENVPIQLDAKPDEVKTIEVKADVEKLLAMRKTEIVSASDRISSNIQIRDISVAPLGEPLYSDAIAIVLGAEENGYDIAPAPYAARDAKIMAKYFSNTLGIRNVYVYTNKDLTKSRLSDIFDKNGLLERTVVPGKTDVFVFYSGHGMPDEDASGKNDVYLFPYDGRKDLLKERGYSLNRLYTNLNELNAKSVTVILDACFSGSSRRSASISGESIGNTKGISIRLKDLGSRPWETNPNFRLITSSSGEQTSLGFDQSRSGLFTYYFAVGMQGDADLDKNGTITMKELFDFVSEKVSSTAKKIRNGEQTPEFYGNTDFVIEKMK